MTNPTPHGQVPAIQRYKIGYHADEWGHRSSTPSGIPDASGSWVRYADHVTALAAGQATAAQQGAAYAAQPSYEHQRAIMEGERNASLDAYSRVVSITSAESRLYERAFTSGWDRRDRLASYGQAPAQAAPAAVAGPSEFPHEQMDVMALARYKVVPAHESMFHRFAVVAGDGKQQLYIGREVECENMARKFAGAFLDGAFAFHSMRAAAPTAQPVPRHQARINGDSAAPKLRAMATNYTAGHQWDKLDAQACILGALEIEALRSQAPHPSPAAQGDARSMLRIVADYSDWLDSKGRLTSFSAFVNEFGYEERDCKTMYEKVVLPCIDAARAAQGGK